MLSGKLAVLQAPMFDRLSLDPFTWLDDGWSPAEVGIGRRHVVQALLQSGRTMWLDHASLAAVAG
jgi:hypothetical protein